MVCPVQKSGNPDLLLDYCARRLDAGTMASLSRHMSSCADCRKFADAQSLVWSALDAWEAEPVSDEFDDRLYARISEEERRSFWARLLGDRMSWKPALSLGVACATLALVVIFEVRDVRTPVLPDTSVNQVEALDAEQIERSVEDLEMLRQFSTPATSSPTL